MGVQLPKQPPFGCIKTLFFNGISTTVPSTGLQDFWTINSEKGPFQKEWIVFQAWIFAGDMLGFLGGLLEFLSGVHAFCLCLFGGVMLIS